MRLRLSAVVIALFVSGIATAQRLPRTVIPSHYDLTFAPDFATDSFEGDETIQVTVSEPLREIVLHAVDLEFREVTIRAGDDTQTASVTPEPAKEWARLSVERDVLPGPATIHIRFRGVLNANLRGFYRGEANGRKYASTQFEATDAREAFPSFDEPPLKATFAISAVVDENDTAISNGAVISDAPGPVAGKRTFRFATTPRISTYLVALTVGDFRCLRDEAAGTPLGICGTPDKMRMAPFAMDATKFIIPWYKNYYGLNYPFGKLDQTGVADFRYGAMENPGAILYRDSALFLDTARSTGAEQRGVSGVIAHEIAHMWFGDLVTMRWWDDIWLNEGFATWIAAKPLRAWRPEWKIPLREVAATGEALRADSLETSRKIRQQAATPSEIMELFDGIAYGKTAAVLRMIESTIGEDAMRRGVGDYLATHGWGNTTFHDFSEAIARASDPSVAEILRSYVEQPGAPLLRASAACENGETLLTIEQQRFFSNPSPRAEAPELWTVPLCYRAGGVKTCELVRGRRQAIRIAGCGPLFLNADGLGYYVVEPSRDMLAQLVGSIDSLTPAERLVLLRDEWSLVQSGRRSVDEYLRLVDAFGEEREPLVVKQILDTLDRIDREIVSDADRGAFAAWIRTSLQPLASELGFTAQPQDDEARRTFRAEVLSTLGLVGRDARVLKQARTLIEKDIAGRAKLDPELRDSLTNLAAAGGDAKLHDLYVAQIRQASTPSDRNRFLNALAFFPGQALVDRTLEFALSESVKTQDLWVMAVTAEHNPGGPDPAWRFLAANWTRVEQKLPEPMRGGVLGSARVFCDREALERMKQFYAAHPVEEAARTTAQALERIGQCVVIRTMQSPKLHSWLAEAHPVQ